MRVSGMIHGLCHRLKNMPLRNHWLVYMVLAVLSILFMIQSDIVITSVHSFVFVDTVFQGEGLNFYSLIHEIAAKWGWVSDPAYYGIGPYIVFGIFMLPYYLFTLAAGMAPSIHMVFFLGKVTSAAFLFGCTVLIHRIFLQLGLEEQKAHWGTLFFALFPVGFYCILGAGQYDSIGLFFTLLAYLYWLKGKTLQFSLWFSVAIIMKIFPLFLFVLLLLLHEKRILHLLKYLCISLVPFLAVSVIFQNGASDASWFTYALFNNLFIAQLPGSINISIFPFCFFLLCILAFLMNPDEKKLGEISIWLGLVCYGIMFMFFSWNPQWFMYLAPFFVLSIFMQKNTIKWFYLHFLFFVGFFLFCALNWQYNMDGSFFFGLMTKFVPDSTFANGFYPFGLVLEVVPNLKLISGVLISGVILAHIILMFPASNGNLASRLANDMETSKPETYKFAVWIFFAASYAVWLLPALAGWFAPSALEALRNALAAMSTF